MRIKELKKKHQDSLLNIIGFLFLGWGIIAIATSLYNQNPNQIFWNCYISLFIIGIGILNRNGALIGSQLAILAIPLLIWDIDFIYYFASGKSLLGITDYMFIEQRLAISQFISLQHLFTVPLSLFALSKIKSETKHFWKISVIQVTLMFVIVSLLTPREANINCVFDPCINVTLGLPYKLTWFLIFFTLIFITNFILLKFKFLFSNKNYRTEL